MSNPNAPPAPSALPPLASLLKPEQVSRVNGLPEGHKASYTQGITKLWEQIQNRPQDSPEYQAAYRKLIEVTTQIRAVMRKSAQDQAAQAAQAQHNNTRPASQGQQDPRQQGPQVNHAGTQPQEQFSQKVLLRLRSQTFIVPQQMTQQGPEMVARWMQEAKLKYAQHLQRYEAAAMKLQELGQLAQDRSTTGKSFSPDEAHALNNRKNAFQRTMQEAKDYISKFQAHQDQLKAASAGASNFEGSRDPGLQALSAEQTQGPQAARQPHTVNSAVEAIRNQTHTSGRPGISPVSVGPSTQQSNVIQGPNSHHTGNHGQVSNSHHATNHGQQSNSHPNSAVIASTGPPTQQHNPQPTPIPQSATPQGVHPLSHQAAMAQAAQSYAQPNYQQSTPQSTTHTHPQMGGNREHLGNRDSQNSNNVKMPIPKDLKVTPPQPVVMGPARPTLTGGPTNGAMGPMGQPAIQKHPGYVLEGEGERVLSKKKLQELVRQVTGGSGGEGEEGETLSADVEDVSFSDPQSDINT